MEFEFAIPTPAVVVLIGASGSGKSTWAERHFKPGQVLSTDAFRALTGAGPDDQTAGTEAFALLDHLIGIRLAKGLTTVIDTLGLDDERRDRYRQQATDAGMATVAVGFDTDPALCHDRNRERANPLPKTALDKQLRQWRKIRKGLDGEGFDLVVVDPGPARQVPATMLSGVDTGPAVSTEDRTANGADEAAGLAFDLVVSSFEFGDRDMAATLADIALAAEEVGFRALWVMDHFRQVPQVGRAWEPMLEAYTTLAWLAARTERLRLGTLVTNVEHRNVGLLAKIVATLDVLSGGRAECGIGAGWFSAEQKAFGYPVNPDRIRLDTLAEALQALPVLWGPGSKSFEGEHVHIPEALAYPRPVQDPMPILVGGGGERRTLRLAAAHAAACNVMGNDLDEVARKIEIVRAHCVDVGRDPDDLIVTTLNPLVHATDGPGLDRLVDSLRPANQPADSFAAVNHAATTDEHVARFRQLADLGVGRICVALTANDGPDRVRAFGSVIDAFRPGP